MLSIYLYKAKLVEGVGSQVAVQDSLRNQLHKTCLKIREKSMLYEKDFLAWTQQQSKLLR